MLRRCRPFLPISAMRMAQRDCATGLYLQMYYWGRDVRDPHGNLLCRYGFERIEKRTAHGCSRYRIPWKDGLIELHGFVAGWYRPQGNGFLFVRRRHACQTCHETQPVSPDAVELAVAHTPRTRAECEAFAPVLGEFLRFVLDYEAFIAAECGPHYRQEVFEEYRDLRLSHWWLPPAEAEPWYRKLITEPGGTPRARRWAASSSAVNH